MEKSYFETKREKTAGWDFFTLDDFDLKKRYELGTVENIFIS